jgi:sulfatase modifying factor 1
MPIPAAIRATDRLMKHAPLVVLLAAACSHDASPHASADNTRALSAAGPLDGEADDAAARRDERDSSAGASDGSALATAACPSGMVLVDGDYCSDLELTCQKSWYAKWNDKTICESFEEPSRCVGARRHKRYCIDEYEYPNEKGQRPRVMFTFGEAQHLCAALGKRVCTETEWTMACEGPSYKPYPYGYVRDPSICNGDRPYIEPKVVGHDAKGRPFFAFASKNPAVAGPELERLWQGVASGSQPKCVSDYGVWDMAGNADELASSETPEPTSKFDNVTTGGPWLYGVRNQCRPKIYTHDEGFDYYYLSTRCCAEPGGIGTDPRAPKQVARHERWRP